MSFLLFYFIGENVTILWFKLQLFSGFLAPLKPVFIYFLTIAWHFMDQTPNLLVEKIINRLVDENNH